MKFNFRSVTIHSWRYRCESYPKGFCLPVTPGDLPHDIPAGDLGPLRQAAQKLESRRRNKIVNGQVVLTEAAKARLVTTVVLSRPYGMITYRHGRGIQCEVLTEYDLDELCQWGRYVSLTADD